MTPWRVRFLTRVARVLGGRPLRLLGVDVDEFLLLLEAHVLLEHRRADVAAGPLASLRNALQTLLVILAAHVSLAIGAAAYVVDDRFVWMASFQALVAGLVAIPVVVEYVPALLEIDDVAVVEALPIRERSYLAVRAAHVILSLGVLVVAIALPAALIAALIYRSALVVPVTLIASAATTVATAGAFTAVVVAAVRWADPARARTVVGLTQIGCAVVAFGALQLGAPLIERLGLPQAVAADPRLWALVPPAYGAGLLRLSLGAGQPGDELLALLTFALPAAVLLLVRGLTGPRLLVDLTAAASRAGRSRPRSGLARRIAAAATRPGAERAGYEFLRSVAATERRYRLTVWGATAAIVLMVANMAVTFGIGGRVVPFTLYGVVLIVLGAGDTARVSENWRARSIFLDLAADERSDFVRGATRHIAVTRLVVPCLVVVVPCVALDPAGVGVDAVAAAGAAVVLGTLALRIGLDRMPFTEVADAGRPLGESLRLLGVGPLIALAAAVHVGMTFMPYGRAALAVLWAAWAAVAWRRFLRARPEIPPVVPPTDAVDAAV